jgi:hypothetical protein
MMCSNCNTEKEADMMCDCGACKPCCGGSCQANKSEGGEASS